MNLSYLCGLSWFQSLFRFDPDESRSRLRARCMAASRRAVAIDASLPAKIYRGLVRSTPVTIKPFSADAPRDLGRFEGSAATLLTVGLKYPGAYKLLPCGFTGFSDLGVIAIVQVTSYLEANLDRRQCGSLEPDPISIVGLTEVGLAPALAGPMRHRPIDDDVPDRFHPLRVVGLRETSGVVYAISRADVGTEAIVVLAAAEKDPIRVRVTEVRIEFDRTGR